MKICSSYEIDGTPVTSLTPPVMCGTKPSSDLSNVLFRANPVYNDYRLQTGRDFLIEYAKEIGEALGKKISVCSFGPTMLDKILTLRSYLDSARNAKAS